MFQISLIAAIALIIIHGRKDIQYGKSIKLKNKYNIWQVIIPLNEKSIFTTLIDSYIVKVATTHPFGIIHALLKRTYALH